MTLRIPRIVHLVVRSSVFTDDQEPHIAVGVVDETVRDARSRDKDHALALGQAMQVAIDPRIGRSFEDIDKLFLGLFSMRITCASARRQAFVVNADTL